MSPAFAFVKDSSAILLARLHDMQMGFRRVDRVGRAFHWRHRRQTATAFMSEGKSETMAKTVLIVEDNDLNMKLFRDLLEAHGYQTVQTRNGLEAMDLAREHHPDLILMDIQLPEISGLEVTKWLKEDDELKMIPVIAVTAFAMKGDEERIRQGGCEAYLSKPISIGKFLETVRSYLGDA